MLNRNELIRELEKIRGVRVLEAHLDLQGANGELEWYFEKNELMLTFWGNDPLELNQTFRGFTYQTILEIFQRFE